MFVLGVIVEILYRSCSGWHQLVEWLRRLHHDSFVCFAFALRTSQVYLVGNRVGPSRSVLPISFFHMGFIALLPAILKSPTYTDGHKPIFDALQKHSDADTLLHPSFNGTSASFRSHKQSCKWMSAKVSLQWYFKVCHVVPWFWASRSWHAYPNHIPVIFPILDHLPFFHSVCWNSIAGFACAFWQSRNYIWYNGNSHVRCRRTLFSENCIGSWTILHGITTWYDAPLVLLQFIVQFGILRWHNVHDRCNMNCVAFFLCFLGDFFFVSDFELLPNWRIFNLFHSWSTATFACIGSWNKL